MSDNRTFTLSWAIGEHCSNHGLPTDAVSVVEDAAPRLTVKFAYGCMTTMQPQFLLSLEDRLCQVLDERIEIYLQERPDESPVRRMRKNAVAAM